MASEGDQMNKSNDTFWLNVSEGLGCFLSCLGIATLIFTLIFALVLANWMMK